MSPFLRGKLSIHMLISYLKKKLAKYTFPPFHHLTNICLSASFIMYKLLGHLWSRYPISLPHTQGKDLAKPSTTLLLQVLTQAWLFPCRLSKVHPLPHTERV